MGLCQNAAGFTGCGRSESDAEGEFELVVAEFGVDLGGGHGFRHGGILVVVEVLVLVGELVEVGDVGVEVAEVESETSGDGLQGVVAVQVAFGVGRRPVGVACPQAKGAREAEFRSGPEIVGAAVDLLYHVVRAEDVGVLVRHVAVIVVAVLGYSPTTAFTVAASLAQIGEFSFILAQTGYSLQLISRDIFSVLIVCAMISIAANPFFMGRMTEAEAWARKQPKLWRWLTFRMESKAASLGSVYAERVRSEKTERPRAIIAGYGPTGRRAAALLERRGMEPVVVDMNLKTVSLLNEQGKLAMYGDVSREEVLKAAGAEQADCFIITIPDVAGAAAAAMAARNCSATIKIFARSRFLNDEALLKQAGADSILFEEDAVAHELSHTIELYLNDRKAK